MSKFKVGDKVYRLEDRKEANVLWEVSSIRVMKNGDKEYHNYILKAEGDFDAGAKYKHAFLNFEEDLELYKTPHERLVELGWKQKIDNYEMVRYSETIDTFIYDITLIKGKKPYFIDTNKHPVCFNLELAEVLVDYLKELENDEKKTD